MHRTLIPAAASMAGDKMSVTQDSIQIAVYVQAEVMAPSVAQHKVNAWLSMHVGHLLVAENPELLLTDPLQWRFDVVLCTPQLSTPGHVTRTPIGRLCVDAVTGAALDPENTIQELTDHAGAPALRSA